MYVVTIITPSNENPNKMVKTYFVRFIIRDGIKFTDYDEDIKYARVFINKIDAKKVQSKLRTLIGSEKAKIELRNKYSKN